MEDQVKIDRHEVVLFWDKFGDNWSSVSIYLDSKKCGTLRVNIDQEIIFLEEFNLEKISMAKKGFGRRLLGMIEEHFSDYLYFFLQYETATKSDVFYKKCGFKDFFRSRHFSKDKRNYYYALLDEFCGQYYIVYKKLKGGSQFDRG